MTGVSVLASLAVSVYPEPMDWFRYIDSYCERLAPGFWGEPLNAVSNAAFLFAAAAAVVCIQRRPSARTDIALWLLTSLVAIIGIGSFLFHTFANYWSMLADVIPISIFIYAYLGYALRRYLGAGWVVTLGAVAIFAVGSFVLDGLVPARILNGSVGYLPALGALFAIALLLAFGKHPAARGIAVGGAILTVSLVFRTFDSAVCASWPTGTHYVWHCLNAALLFTLLNTAANYGRVGPFR